MTSVMGISPVWMAVWRRNYLVWKKLAAESVLGNIIEPLFYLVGFGLGFGSMLPEVDGVRYIAYLAGGTICFATQNLEELERFAQRVVVLQGGAVVFSGSPREYEAAELEVFH